MAAQRNITRGNGKPFYGMTLNYSLMKMIFPPPSGVSFVPHAGCWVGYKETRKVVGVLRRKNIMPHLFFFLWRGGHRTATGRSCWWGCSGGAVAKRRTLWNEYWINFSSSQQVGREAKLWTISESTNRLRSRKKSGKQFGGGGRYNVEQRFSRWKSCWFHGSPFTVIIK